MQVELTAHTTGGGGGDNRIASITTVQVVTLDGHIAGVTLKGDDLVGILGEHLKLGTIGLTLINDHRVQTTLQGDTLGGNAVVHKGVLIRLREGLGIAATGAIDGSAEGIGDGGGGNGGYRLGHHDLAQLHGVAERLTLYGGKTLRQLDAHQRRAIHKSTVGQLGQTIVSDLHVHQLLTTHKGVGTHRLGGLGDHHLNQTDVVAEGILADGGHRLG